MTEKQFRKILKKLNIGNNKSNVEIKELLDAKLNEYLDRQDESAEEMVSDIQDALDYVEELIDKMGGGIALAPDESEELEDSEEINRDLLGQAAKNGKKGAAAFTSSADTGGQAGTNVQGTSASAGGVNPKGKPWFYSLYGDQKVEDMFEMAESDLNQGDFKHAASVFDMILKIEVTNTGAYMGKVLAAHHLKDPNDIATCYDKGLENQPELKRAEGVGNEKQKKFIQDTLEERRKAMIYIEADKTLQMRNNPSELIQAATQFESLGSYRDSSKKADECREASKQVQEAEKRRKEEEKKRKEEEKKRKEEQQKRWEEEKKRKEEQRKKELEEQRIKDQKEFPKKVAKTILDIPNIILAIIMAEGWGWTWSRFIRYPIDVITDVFTGLGVWGEIGNTTGVVSTIIGRVAPFIACVVFNILLFRNNKKMRTLLSKEKTLKEAIIVTVLLVVAAIILRMILYRLGLGRLMAPIYNMTY